MQPTELFESEARRRGYRRIAGLDEAGRGPLAGPVAAAAVILPRGFFLFSLDDSKLLEESARDALYDQIMARAVGVGLGWATPEEIDRINILEATRLAMTRAVACLSPAPDYLLLDAISLPAVACPQRPIIKGDGLSVSIAAASVIAKVSRDRLMRDEHRRYPAYGFDIHKGYPTPDHLRSLVLHGPCAIHRRSFRPVAEVRELISP